MIAKVTAGDLPRRSDPIAAANPNEKRSTNWLRTSMKRLMTNGFDVVPAVSVDFYPCRSP